MKITENYSFDFEQFFSFRTILFLPALSIITYSCLTDILFKNILLHLDGIVFFLFSLSFLLYFIWHDFIVRNNNFKQDEDLRTKYNNYNLEEHILEMNSGNYKGKNMLYEFYYKIIDKVIKDFYYEDYVSNFPGKKEAIDESLEEIFDPSFTSNHFKHISNLENAKKYTKKQSSILYFGTLSILEIYNSDDELILEEKEKILKENNFDKTDIKKIKIAIKALKDFFDEDENFYIIQNFSEIPSELRYKSLTIILSNLTIIYFSNNKLDIFEVIRYIFSPFSLIFKIFKK